MGGKEPRFGERTPLQLLSQAFPRRRLIGRRIAHAADLESNLVNPRCHARHDPQHSSFGVLKRRGRPSCPSGSLVRPKAGRSASPAVSSAVECGLVKTTEALQEPAETQRAGPAASLCQISGAYQTRLRPVIQTYASSLFMHAPMASIFSRGRWLRV